MHLECRQSIVNIRIYKCDISQFFARALTFSDILTFQIFYIENCGKGHRAQHSQWGHSMTNKKYKRHTAHFARALTVSEI